MKRQLIKNSTYLHYGPYPINISDDLFHLSA